jgi:hypothetical protein
VGFEGFERFMIKVLLFRSNVPRHYKTYIVSTNQEVAITPKKILIKEME